MKKILSLLTLSTLAFGLEAHAENLFVNNKAPGTAIHVFTTEKVDGEEILKDSVCLMPGNTMMLQDFTPLKKYKVIVEYQARGCDGPTRDISADFVMFDTDMQVDINGNYMVFSEKV